MATCCALPVCVTVGAVFGAVRTCVRKIADIGETLSDAERRELKRRMAYLVTYW